MLKNGSLSTDLEGRINITEDGVVRQAKPEDIFTSSTGVWKKDLLLKAIIMSFDQFGSRFIGGMEHTPLTDVSSLDFKGIKDMNNLSIGLGRDSETVSYTHLTLPTICSV